MDDIKRLGSLFGHTGGSFAGLVYDPNGLAPAINTAGGGLRMPLIIEVIEDTKPIIKKLGTMNPNSSQRRIVYDSDGICPTLQAAMGEGGDKSQ